MNALASPRPRAHAAGAGVRQAARIGPNAIIQLAGVLADRVGASRAGAILTAHTSFALDRLPHEMVDEGEVTRLVQAVLRAYPDGRGAAFLREAGARTAEYLLRARIPRLAQRVLSVLPPSLSLRMLLAAIARHAWTFAGSASFEVARTPTGGTTFALRGCPACRGLRLEAPACHFYAATVEGLVRAIVQPLATVHEQSCEAVGATACRFSVTLGPAPRAAAPTGPTW